MGKRKYTAEFKAGLVLEVLRGEREIGQIAAEHNINPNQLRAWKTSFLEKAPALFEENKVAKEAARKEQEAAAEKQAMLKTIGQLTMERDFLQEEIKKKDFKVYLRRG